MSTGELKGSAGQRVWILLNHIKADKRDQFERFNRDILGPTIQQESAEAQQAMRQTRILAPTEPNADGTYTYIYVLDPFVEGIDYGIENLLKRHLGDDEGARTFQQFTGCFDRPQDAFMTVDTRF